MGVIPLSFLASHWFRSWSSEIWLARHGRHCCLVKSQGGYSLAFQIPGMTVPVSFRAIGLIWVSEVDCWADVLLMSFPSHSSLYLPCGRLFLRLLWGTDTIKDTVAVAKTSDS